MLLQFSPWQDLQDLKAGFEGFGVAFAWFESTMTDGVRDIINNIQAYHECAQEVQHVV
jgi:hypothetical protein